MEHQIAARPQAGGLLHRAVAEKGQHDLLRPGDGQHLPQAKGALLLLLRPAGPSPPQGQADQQHAGQRQLDQRHGAVACVPASAPGQHAAHQIRAQRRAHAPHAVQPAHVAAGVVQGHVVVQRRVHTARPQTVGHGPQAQHPEGGTGGKSQQGRRRDGHAEHRHLPRPQCAAHPLAEQAGHHGAQRDDHGHHPCPGHAYAQVPVHHRPRRAQHGVGQAQTDKGQIDHGQKQMRHVVSSVFPVLRQNGRLSRRKDARSLRFRGSRPPRCPGCSS